MAKNKAQKVPEQTEAGVNAPAADAQDNAPATEEVAPPIVTTEEAGTPAEDGFKTVQMNGIKLRVKG